MSAWARITEFPDYAISGEGQVMRLTDGTNFLRPAKAGTLRKLQILSNGYVGFLVRRPGTRATNRLLVHREVAKNFVPNPESKPEVNHKDGCRAHNSWTNLEWVTRSENQRDAFTKRGKRAWSLTPDKTAFATQLLNAGWAQQKIADCLGVGQTSISRLSRGKQRKSQ